MIKDILESNETVKPEDERLKKLKDLFPGCFHRDGSFDFDEMKRILTGKVTIDNEGYELNFLGKNYARLLASLDTTTVVVPDEENNKLPENKDSDNIYISGDNIDALKHLLKSYEGQIKCIYIDPPYNTGSDGFVYNDKFNFSEEDLMEKLSIDAVDAERLMEFTKRKSASHSAWLTFIYPRLQLARDLLTDDGVIFISIDDNEQANLKLICDDIFGEENMIAQFIWKKRQMVDSRTKNGVSKDHDYLLCYSRHEDGKIRGALSDLTKYKNPDNDPKGPWMSADMTGLATEGQRPNLHYDLVNPLTGIVYSCPKTGWRYEPSRMEEFIESGEVLFPANPEGRPRRKKYLKDVESKYTGLSSILNTVYSTQGTREIEALFDGHEVFDFPKPVDYIKMVLNQGCDEGYVLDFFSGSGTTAQALMELNAEEESERHFILVQLPEKVQKDSEAEKMGFFTIDQIGMERIRRAAKKIKEANPDTKADLGFRHYTLQEPDPEVVDLIENFTIESDADLFTDNNIYKKFGKDTILATWLIRDGYHFAKASEVEKVDLHGYTGYFIGKHLYLIEPQMPEEAVMALMDRYGTDSHFRPTHVVVFGYNFTWTELENLKNNLTHFRDTEDNLRISLDIRY
jgi:type III restriction enzyme/adenine-specific DNA-methyltransferase